jgi:hypothetical protein
MIWQSVESSQIEAVGYEAETETLGIRFTPTKKQKEAGQRGSEYHYQFVPQDVHAALMTAESVGRYFHQHIKPFPEKYPFTKIETEPQQVS